MELVKGTMNQRKPKRSKGEADPKSKKGIGKGGQTFHALKGDRT